MNLTAAVDMSTLTVDDLSLTRGGAAVSLVGATVTSAGAGYAANAVKILIPTSATTEPGAYELKVIGAGVENADGVAVANDIASKWETQALFSSLTQPTSPRTTAVSSQFILNVNAPIDMATFTIEDLKLLRGGNAVDLTGATIALAGAGYAPNAVKIIIPTAATTTPGSYELQVIGTGILTTTGAAVGNSPVSTWQTTSSLTSITQYPTTLTNPLRQTFMNVGAPVDLSSLGAADIQLTLNGIAQSTAGITFDYAGDGYAANAIRINLPHALTSARGTYVLTVNGAGILNTGGSAFTGSVSTTWTY